MLRARRSCNSRYKTSGTDATATTASSTNHDVPPPPRLPPIDPSPNRMLNAIRQGASAVVATIASPFRRAASLPILAINSSPSASVGLSELTHHSDEPKESDESILLLAAADLAEKGDGADSDEEGEEMRLHFECATGVDDFSSAEQVDLDSEDEGEEIFSIPGSPDGWAPPQPLSTFLGYHPKPNSNAPASFDLVDNPGGWSAFVFQPKYAKGGKYESHFSPAGAKILPVDPSTGERSINKWVFHYNGWDGDEFTWSTCRRVEATPEDIKPAGRGPKLDQFLLESHGINDTTISSPLHFYQLLLPLCDPSRSGIHGDGRMPFWTMATDCSNMYATCEKGWGGGYSHAFKQVTVPELVKFAAVPVRHGARGGNPQTLHYRFLASDPDYDVKIASAMSQSRWCQIKQVFKLQNNFVEPSRGAPGYNPAFRYDPIYKVMCHNMNYFTKKADDDFGVDETTWGFMGYSGECGGRLNGKMVSKGGQTTMVFDCARRWPRAYVHRNKSMIRPTGFNAEGPAEMYHLLNAIEEMIHGTPDATCSYRNHRGDEVDYPVKKIYYSYPHGTADNHFSGDHIMDYAGAKGFGLTMTCRRDRLPSGLKPFLHHEKVLPSDQRAKCMRFENPIVAIKKVEATEDSKAYTRTHVSFQSTGATNISGVNNIGTCNLAVSRRDRGIGSQKRTWGIEWNEARSLYLKTYWAVDNVDHMIKNAGIKYKSWKYWHAPFNHAHAIAIIAAYDIYKYCCEGLADPDWFVEESKRMCFREFRLKLSAQMLEWDPAAGLLPGDSHFRYYTKLTTKQRSKRKSDAIDYDCEGVSEANFNLAKMDKRQRLCGDLEDLIGHTESMTRKTNQAQCEVCGKKTLWRCGKCNKALCVMEKSAFAGGTCMLRYHSDTFFGLAKCDAKMHDMAEWKPSNGNKIKRHAEYMRSLVNTMKETDGLGTLDDIDLGGLDTVGI